MSVARNRVEVINGVNLDQLGRRDPALYGALTLTELELRVDRDARELGLVARFFATNHEGDLVEHLHRLEGVADAILINPGAWGHYAWAIRDALEIAALPTVEVHISEVEAREEWRRRSVIADLCLAKISGRGIDGYREGLTVLRDALAG